MKKLLLYPSLLLSLALSAQEPINIQNGCNFDGDETETEYYTFDASGEADRIVKKILDATGSLSHKSIILKESNVKNALATTEGKNRYLLYSAAFLEKFKGDAKTKWAAYTVLAHEIGHHLNGHDFAEKDLKKRKSMELEADKFAGAVCRTLGASLEQAMAGMESMQLSGESTTHPAKSARTAAIANGWKKQDEILGGARAETQPAVSESKPPSPSKANPADGTVSKILEAQKPKPPQITNITVAYQGDLYGCGLQLAMNIGGVQFVPMSNSFLVTNVPVGIQQYSISGTIACPAVGSCTAGGSGQINVVPGGTYLVMWSNSAYAQCTVQLVANQ
jgi:hypothetical protein